LAKTALLIFLALAFTLGEETTTAIAAGLRPKLTTAFTTNLHIAFFYSSSEKIVPSYFVIKLLFILKNVIIPFYI
jgi:hypothetical protein